MRIFSKHQKKLEPKRRFGGINFRNKLKEASNYKRAFNPSGLSLALSSGGRMVRIGKILGIAMVILIGYVAFSSTFSITNITVTGNHQISGEQIQEVLGSTGNSRQILFKKNNFFLMTHGQVNKTLTKNIPTIKEVVTFKRIWPNRATVEIREHTPGFVIESDGNLFLVDDEGMVVGEISDPGKLLIVRDQLVENFVRGETLPNQKLAPFILSMNKMWKTKINTAIETVSFPGKSSNDVQFVTTAGYSVLFDSARPVTVQLSSLAVILNKQIGAAQIPNLAYVDLRISKWAYYCFKESPCQQKAQPETAGAETNVEQ